MKRYTLIFVLAMITFSAHTASAQNPDGRWFNGYSGDSRNVRDSYNPCYSYGAEGVLCDQFRKRLDRQFETENAWGKLKIKSIPRQFALHTDVFQVWPDGTEHLITGANTVNNWWEAELPIEVGTRVLRFKYIGEQYNVTVDVPVRIVPAHVGRDLHTKSRFEITLTANHFNNADVMKANLHHQEVENPDGSHSFYVRTKDGEWLEAKQAELKLLRDRVAQLETEIKK